MSAEEPVTSPDQHKVGSPRAARVGAVITIIALVAMLFPGNKGNIENWFLGLTAALIAAALVGDWLLRKNGLR